MKVPPWRIHPATPPADFWTATAPTTGAVSSIVTLTEADVSVLPATSVAVTLTALAPWARGVSAGRSAERNPYVVAPTVHDPEVIGAAVWPALIVPTSAVTDCSPALASVALAYT